MPGSLILPCFNIFKFFKTSFRFPASTHLRHRSESKNPSGWFLISQINFVNISWPLCSSEKIHNIKHGGYIIYMIRRVWTRKNFLLNFPPFCQLKEENQEGTVFIFVRKKCKKRFLAKPGSEPVTTRVSTGGRFNHWAIQIVNENRSNLKI